MSLWGYAAISEPQCKPKGYILLGSCENSTSEYLREDDYDDDDDGVYKWLHINSTKGGDQFIKLAGRQQN